MQFVLTRTPLRISFFGGGSDYPAWCDDNRGAVLSTTIDKYIYLSCRYHPPFFGVNHRIVWRHVELVESISEILHPAIREGLKYLSFDDSRGVEMHYHADLPARSGMGSSSSFVAGMILGLLRLKSKDVSKHELAKMAIDLELNWMNEAVGYQDQIAAAYGGLNRIEFKAGQKFDVNPVPISKDRSRSFLTNLMLFFVGANRDGLVIAEKIINNVPKNTSQLKKMVELVDDAEATLKAGDLINIGEMLHETWMLKRELSNHISTSKIDDIYASAQAAGAIGGKLLGAGGTGFMLFFVPPDKQESVRGALTPQLMEIPFDFVESGSEIVYDLQENES
jgi:D-glycero-alpha-D-manno-heptose-7-phosphate kinase